ncbi:hypothetical protein PRZ48_010608 [Zasmidium cellare]|uniref:Uncharacterized protein n=1 Tax=Zasmidium cellare TaxID=395010 RepID=A0ABR0E956_ZASCE|nr:hypothetical protein PRZ48_010608 [Zasmidium cellare]
MCRAITLHYTCTHTHSHTLSPCRHTKLTPKRDGTLTPFCKAYKRSTYALHIRLSTPCPSCYAQRLLDRKVLGWVEYGPRRSYVWQRAVTDVREVKSLMRMVRVGEGRDEGIRRRVGRLEGELGLERTVPKVKEKRKVFCRKVVNGGSPLRRELRVEDLEDVEERRQEKANGDEMREEMERREIVAWPEAREMLRDPRGEAAMLSRIMARDQMARMAEAQRRVDAERREQALAWMEPEDRLAWEQSMWGRSGWSPWNVSGMFCLGF